MYLRPLLKCQRRAKVKELRRDHSAFEHGVLKLARPDTVANCVDLDLASVSRSQFVSEIEIRFERLND